MNKKLFPIIIALLILPLFCFGQIVVEYDLPEIGGKTMNPQSTLPDIIKYVFNIALFVCLAAVLFALLFAGVQYLTATGDPGKMSTAKKRIYSALFGVLILAFSFFLFANLNPQLLILRIKKKAIIIDDGVLLLNSAACDAIENNSGVDLNGDGVDEFSKVRDILSSADSNVEADKEAVAELVAGLLKQPACAEITNQISCPPAARYLKQSVSDLTALFGDLIISQKQCGNGSYGSQTFRNFDLRCIYFMPGAQVRVKEYFGKDFISANGFDQTTLNKIEPRVADKQIKRLEKLGEEDVFFIPDGEWVYPNCSKYSGNANPCVFNIYQGKTDIWPNSLNSLPCSPPLSLSIEPLNPAVFLRTKADKQAQLQFVREISFDKSELIASLYDDLGFTSAVEEIEIRNWRAENNKNVKKNNFLVILHKKDNFSGNLRVFFEEFDTESMLKNIGLGFIISNFTGSLPKNRDNSFENNASTTLKDVLSGDGYGKVEIPNSAHILRMPNTDAEWKEWADGYKEKEKDPSDPTKEIEVSRGCKITLCVEKYLPIIENSEGCYEIHFTDSYLKAQDLVDLRGHNEKFLKIKRDGKGNPNVENDADGNVTGYEKEEVESMKENVRSMAIEGKCAVVLFENDAGGNFGDGGGKSEVFLPAGKEFQEGNGVYRDLTIDNNLYRHETGRCGCLFENRGWMYVFGKCEPCAQSIAIYPLKELPLMPEYASYQPTMSCKDGTNINIGTCSGVCCEADNLNICGPMMAKNGCAVGIVNSKSGMIRDAISLAGAGFPGCPNINTERLVKAIMSQESGGISGQTSSAGAVGVMQILPSTAAVYRGACGVDTNTTITANWLETHEKEQICMAIKYMQSLVAPCGCEIRNIAAGYNGGGTNACGRSDDCNQCQLCGEPTRRWQCFWEDPAHTTCNADLQTGNFSKTRMYAPSVEYCYGQF